ncbi:estradiol 17-beta-dehydrogenase 11-like isoform X3 [Ornithorhynchus anatinus]|uniref:estradiol 17-beta-dehydrogenase 11-like isoform X3 n=1 Tax=Ornithorhynchus anatinus TaxID=9258 RepID=UPI0010A8E7AD|nr:estradiol 17-beta-dehydrogenase 11-like isoform X3 [Ornithorhynchus anatinus]
MNIILEFVLLLPLLLFSTLESFIKLFIPKKRKSVKGETVLITGAGHGIGRLTALEFAKLKSQLVLWDINKVKAEVGDVSILVNNAGVVYTSDLFATQDPQIQKTFEVNVLAHFWTTKAFLPAMMKKNHGHIVTVASAAGHTTVPFLLAYCSSKFAAVGFHKALTLEIAALGKNGIKTSCLCPNFINTGFIKNPSTRIGPTLEPEQVVEQLMKGILTNQKMIFVPSYISCLMILENWWPTLELEEVASKLLDGHANMKMIFIPHSWISNRKKVVNPMWGQEPCLNQIFLHNPVPTLSAK